MSYIKSDNQFYVPFSTNNVTFNRGCFTENEIETENQFYVEKVLSIRTIESIIVTIIEFW